MPAKQDPSIARVVIHNCGVMMLRFALIGAFFGLLLAGSSFFFGDRRADALRYGALGLFLVLVCAGLLQSAILLIRVKLALRRWASEHEESSN